LSDTRTFLILRTVTGIEYATNTYKLGGQRRFHTFNHDLLRNEAHLENIFSYLNNLWLQNVTQVVVGT